MAERRMFAKTIIDSDAFIDMPVTARLLYYDLSMRADDDGFVNSPKKIMRMIGASDGDMQVLLDKKFVILFESGVVVIKHWRIHNYIRKDTYNETNYKEEKALLDLDENKAYTLRGRAVDEPSTQVRLGKVSLGKDNIKTIAQNDAQRDTQNTANAEAYAELIDASDLWFDAFWKVYPKKVNKKPAYNKFRKVCKDEKTFNEIMTGLKAQVQMVFSKRERKYIPAPDVWLNQERWTDEVEPEVRTVEDMLYEEHMRNEQGRNFEDTEYDPFGVSLDGNK